MTKKTNAVIITTMIAGLISYFVGISKGMDRQTPKEVTVAKVNKDTIEDLVITSNCGIITIMIGLGNERYISLNDYISSRLDSLKSTYESEKDSLSREIKSYQQKLNSPDQLYEESLVKTHRVGE